MKENKTTIEEIDSNIHLFTGPNERIPEVLKIHLTGGYTGTLENIGKHFGVTRERIRQLEMRGYEILGRTR